MPSVTIFIDKELFDSIEKARGDVKRSTFITGMVREGMEAAERHLKRHRLP
jgi:metal-responsive CopG/Arc/MetJ family transcriptional regulator